MTPEGRFSDVRDQTAELMPGLAHLCTRMDRGWVVPLALEYTFWEERLPECLARTGKPISVSDHVQWTKLSWTQLLSERLRQTQADLAELSVNRSAAAFDHLLSGQRGGGVVYDSMRRVKSVLTGRRFRAAHGEHFER
jgi:hypothetical protein